MSVGIVIVTHGVIGRAMIEAAEFILGRTLEEIRFVPFCQSEAETTGRESVLSVIDEADQGQGVLVLTDIPGASPSNLVESLLQETGSAMVSGLSLAMLIRVWNYRDKPVLELASMAAKGGKLAIRVTPP